MTTSRSKYLPALSPKNPLATSFGANLWAKGARLGAKLPSIKLAVRGVKLAVRGVKLAVLAGILGATNAYGDTELINRKMDELNSRLTALESLLERQLNETTQLKAKIDALAVAIHSQEFNNPSANAPSATSPATQAANQSATQQSTNRPVPATSPATPPANKPPAFTLPKGTAEQQYKFATNLLLKKQYAEASQALNQFIETHPTHKLAANARYWLGETFYARGNYQAAAAAFATAYKQDEKSPKAADNLLKLALSLQAIGKQAEGCKVFASLKQQMAQKPKLFQEKVAKASAKCPA